MGYHVNHPPTLLLSAALAGVVAAVVGLPSPAAYTRSQQPPPPPPMPSEWSVVAPPTDVDLHAVSALSESDMWAVGDAGTVLHWDGRSWVRSPATVEDRLNAIAMLSEADGWIVGDAGTILRWDGRVWTDVPVATSEDLTSVAMVSTVDGWAVGTGGTMLHWDGTTWGSRGGEAAVGDGLTSVAMVASNDGWAVSWSGAIYRWDGTAWTRVDSPAVEYLGAVTVGDDGQAWAVGRWGAILRWDGARWSAVESPTGTELSAVAMASPVEGWAVGYSGTILHWDGRSWDQATSPTLVDLDAVAAISEGDGCVVGRSGTILHRGALGVTPTPTRTSTATRTPRPPGTPTPTHTPGPSPTPSATPTCPPDWQPPRLEIRLEPDTARPEQSVMAHLTGHGLGFADATIWLARDGRTPITHNWRSSTGWTSRATLTFPAPSTTGDWAVSGYGYGEVTACEGGHVYYVYGGAGTRQAITLTVSGASLFVPSAVRLAPPVITAAPTLTPAATRPPSVTPTPTARPTSPPCYFGLDGYVSEASSGGPGVENVTILLSIDGTAQLSVTTDADGFYATPVRLVRSGASWAAVPSKEGFTFDPPGASGSVRGWTGEQIERVSFVALPETP